MLYNLIELKYNLRLHILKGYGAVGSVVWKNYLKGLIFDVRLYQFLSIVFIHTVTPIQIDWNFYIEVLKDLLLNLGLLEYKFSKSSDIYYIFLWSSHRSLFGFKTYIFIVLILLIFIPLLFIIKNYIFIILSLLSVILIKALALDFYKKHFKLFYGRGNFVRGGIRALIKQIINNIDKIIKHLFMIWIISVIMISTFRHCVVYLTTLLNLDNNSFISIILIVSLPFPIFFYLLNFIMKYLNKKKIEDEDYYLYNDYVVGKVNLYRLTYSISIYYLIRNYFCTISITNITIGFMVLSIILLIICIFYGLRIYNKANKASTIAACTVINKHEPLALKAAFEPTAAYVSAFIAITPFLQDGCNKGFMDYYFNTGKTKYYDWKRVIYKNPGVIKKGSTVNFMENRKMEGLYGVDNSLRENLIRDYRPMLDKSPIINMTWKLKYNEGIQRSQDKFKVRPINYFTNPKFYGAVSLVLKGRFLIVNIIRQDSPGCVFIPSYYLPDQDPNSHTKIRDTVNLLECKYNIVIPWDANRNNGLVIFTQAESIDNKSLFRVWRPSVNYTEPELKTVNSYYQVKSKDMLRLRQFDYSIKRAQIIKEKVEVQDKALDLLEPTKILIHKKSKLAHPLAYNEYIADKNYKKLVEFYIIKGKEDNPSNFLVLNMDRTDKHTLKFQDLLNKARSETISSIYSDSSKNRRNVKDLLEIVTGKYNRFKSNNEFIDNSSYYFKTRRDYPIDSLLLTRDKSHMTYFSIYKNGVIEGYKEKQQLIGDLDSSFKLPLVDSRIELINKIASKFTKSEYTNLNLKNIYGVSINRLTFEFFEVRPTSDIWGVFDKGYLGTAAYPEQSRFRHNNNIADSEVYSIIDLENNSVKLPALLEEGECYYLTIPKHDYNLFDNKDELSIRKFMDFIYTTSDGYLAYQSHKDNFSVVKQKSVGFSKKAVDFKNKEYKGVKFTLDAFNRRLERGKMYHYKYQPEPGKALDLMPDEYNEEIALIGQRATFNYEPRVLEEAKPTTAVSKTNTLPESKAKTLDKSKSSKAKTLDKSSKAKTADSRRPAKSKSRAFKNKGGGTSTITLEAATQDMPVIRLIGAGNIAEDSQSSKESIPKKSPWLEDEDIYGYSGDEGGSFATDNTQNNSAARGATIIKAMEPETTMPSIESPPRKLALDDTASYSWSDEPALDDNSSDDMTYIQKAEKPSDNDNNSGSHSAVASASPEKEVIIKDENYSSGEEASNKPSSRTQKAISISSDSSSSDSSSHSQASPSDTRPFILPVNINTLLVTRHRFGGQRPHFLGVRDRYYYLLISEGTDYWTHPRDRELPSNEILDTVVTAYLPTGMESINVAENDLGGIIDAVTVQNRLNQELPEHIASMVSSDNNISYSDSPNREVNMASTDKMDTSCDISEGELHTKLAQAKDTNINTTSSAIDDLSPSIDLAQDYTGVVIGEDSSYLGNPEGGVQDDGGMVIGEAVHYPNMSHLRREEPISPDAFLPFDPCGFDSDFIGYAYHGDMVRRCELEALNLQAAIDEDMAQAPGIPSPLSVDTEGQALSMLNASYLSRDSADSRSIAEVSMAATPPSDTQANQEAGEDPNVLNREPMEIDADLVREVMMNANGEAVIETIDPFLLLPSQASIPSLVQERPVNAEDSPLSNIGVRKLMNSPN